MIKRVKKFVKKIIKKNPFPYIHRADAYKSDFIINNPIEEYRIKFWGGEREFVDKVIARLDPFDIFFDIGSSIGLYSILAGKKLVNGKVFSFEPDPGNLASLRKNFQINGFQNFEIHPIAIGDKQETLRLYTAGSNAYSPSLRPVNGIPSYVDIEVQSIDNLLKEGKLPYPDVVKIDVEGAEMMVLRGMQELLIGINRPKFIFLEVHPEFLPSFDSSELEIRSFIASLPYHICAEESREGQILIELKDTGI